MPKTPLILLCLALCACESAEEKKAKWISFCVQGEFNLRQCEVLYSLKKSSDDASNSADLAAINSGVAIGMSGGRR